jgi:hypothetical protein
MGFDPISSIMDLGKSLIERLIPDPAAKAAATQKLLEMQQAGELAHLAADTDLMKGQIEINKVEAASPLTFISGWRPAVGWVCAGGFAINYVVGPLMAWSCALLHRTFTPPLLDMSALMPLLMALLGLGIMRSVDKAQNVASK